MNSSEVDIVVENKFIVIQSIYVNILFTELVSEDNLVIHRTCDGWFSFYFFLFNLSCKN